MDKFYQQYC